MKTIIMGGGVVGVAAAYYLAKEGHEVTVIERQPSAGCETSFANAGLAVAGHATAWASPQAPMILLKSLFRDDTALRFKFSVDPKLWIWSLYFLRNCTWERQRANTLPKLGLCLYSVEQTKLLLEETGIDCDAVFKGVLFLYRHAEHLEIGLKNMKLLKDHGHNHDVIDVADCVRLDPALEQVRDKLAGALYAPDDFSGDAHKFSQNLAAYCEEKFGTSFMYDTTITGLKAEGSRVTGVVTDKGEVTGDIYVMSLGSYTPGITRTIGIRLPIYPVKGYSVTWPIDGHNGAPSVGGIDEENLVGYCRMGDRLRMTSTAEMSGYDTSYKVSDFKNIMRVARDLFPDGADYDNPSYWACLRPMTPDGPPLIGRMKYDNFYLDTGQGHIGWTMACGSGRVITDLICGRQPEVDVSGLQPNRYWGRRMTVQPRVGPAGRAAGHGISLCGSRILIHFGQGGGADGGRTRPVGNTGCER